MKFVIIDPAAAKVEKVEAEDLLKSFHWPVSSRGEVDFAILTSTKTVPASASSSMEEGSALACRGGAHFSIARTSRRRSGAVRPLPRSPGSEEPRRLTEGSPRASAKQLARDRPECHSEDAHSTGAAFGESFSRHIEPRMISLLRSETIGGKLCTRFMPPRLPAMSLVVKFNNEDAQAISS